MRIYRIALVILGLATSGVVRASDDRYPKGLPDSPEFFPLAVWLQSPANAEKYRDIGINTYVALWNGPTEEKLDALDKAGIRLICGQSERSLRFKDRPTIVAWMHGDEPDNAQSQGRGKGYGPPIPPARIVEGYEKIRRADPDRPVLLNLGQGVAWDGWYGRGRPDQSSRGLSGVFEGLRYRLVRHLSGRAREGRNRRKPLVCPAGRRSTPSLDRRQARTSGAASRRPGSTTRNAGRRPGRSDPRSGWPSSTGPGGSSTSPTSSSRSSSRPDSWQTRRWPEKWRRSTDRSPSWPRP